MFNIENKVAVVTGGGGVLGSIIYVSSMVVLVHLVEFKK